MSMMFEVCRHGYRTGVGELDELLSSDEEEEESPSTSSSSCGAAAVTMTTQAKEVELQESCR